VIVFQFLYLLVGFFFFLSLRGLSSAASSQKGNLFGIAGMCGAIAIAMFFCDLERLGIIFAAILLGGSIGAVIARKIKMASLPQLVAAFHSLVGLAAVMIASATLYAPQVFDIGAVGLIRKPNLIELGIGAVIGAVTFTGSIIAFMKLQGLVKGGSFKNLNIVVFCLVALAFVLLTSFVLTENHLIFWLVVIVSFLFGILFILPIGGADMPVVVSMLNSYSGWAAAATGFTLNNHLLIMTGALVGASGAILSYIMCKNMNRSIVSVIFGCFKNKPEAQGAALTKSAEDRPVKIGGPEDAAFVLANASEVIVVPGYGMAVAQAQYALSEMAALLKAQQVRIRYAVHPVAGRMPGHMNVLLAEAKIPYDEVFELDDINNDFSTTDVVFVIGANDITNPAAHNDPDSPIFGMPILDVEKANTVLFVKRSLGAGYAGVDNELFYRSNTMMLLGDAKKVCEGVVKALKNT
jgi:NAD(P) transhydrogenase subunit beta